MNDKRNNKMIIDLLERAIKKYNELKKDDYWKDKLLDTPPILWFGNIKSEKPKVVTIGANPSCHEFDPCKHRFEKAMKNWIFLMYIKGKNNNLNKIYSSFIDSYNNYFESKNDPYMKWFGKIESFLNGLDATFYEEKKWGYTYQAVHIDLFPFATRQKFTKIKENVRKDLFDKRDCWGQRFLLDLIKLIEPEIIILLGNMNFFEKIYKNKIRPIGPEYTILFKRIDDNFKILILPKNKNGKYKAYIERRYRQYKLNEYIIHTTSLYPPNLPGLYSKDLRELGRRFREEFIEK